MEININASAEFIVQIAIRIIVLIAILFLYLISGQPLILFLFLALFTLFYREMFSLKKLNKYIFHVQVPILVVQGLILIYTFQFRSLYLTNIVFNLFFTGCLIYFIVVSVLFIYGLYYRHLKLKSIPGRRVQMIKCEKCGAEHLRSSIYCQECGSDFKKENKGSKNIISLILRIIVVIGIILIILNLLKKAPIIGIIFAILLIPLIYMFITEAYNSRK